MKRLIAAVLALGLAGCYATATPYGITIEPLAEVVVAGPPVVVAPPPSGMVIRPLPPVYVVPDRRVYYYNNSYYYYWEDNWYWGRDRRGPWHRLDRKYYPPRVEERHDHGKGKGRYK